MNFEFDINNIAQIELPILAQSDCTPNKHFPDVTESRRNNGIINVGFFGNDSCWEYVPKSTVHQLKTLEFIRENQKEILESLFEYTKYKLYPEHIGYIGYDEVSFPDLNNLSDLRQALGIKLISLYVEYGNDSAYYGLTCDFSGDFEHGTNIIMNKLTILGWEENMGKDLVLNDLNK